MFLIIQNYSKNVKDRAESGLRTNTVSHLFRQQQFSTPYGAPEGITTTHARSQFRKAYESLAWGRLPTPSSWPQMTFLDTGVLKLHRPWGLSQILGNAMCWLSGG